jgi:outer membrane receptor protein involved in Fe transport
MPASAILQMLSGMNANNIEKIELITTPPSSFDAEGNAGFINVVLKTNPDLGTNGSYSLTMGYGRGTTPAANINFNHRKEKINLYGDYSFSRAQFIQDFFFYRKINYGAKTTENHMEANRHAVQRNHNMRLGLDYQLTRRTSVGALVSSYDNRWSMVSYNNSFYLINSQKDTAINIINDEINRWRHYMINASLQHSFKNNDKVTVDVDYLYYHDNNPIDYVNAYYDGTNNFLFNEQTKSAKLTPISIYVGKIDYSKKLSKKTDFEAGLKTTISRFNNDVSIQKKIQNNWIVDDAYSASYLLKEYITAAYSSVSIASGPKTSVKLGLRYEYTTSNLGSAKQKDIVDRKYGSLFPGFFLSHKFNDFKGINLSYSRRITRPTFNELAPFVIFFDPNTFLSGNAALQPSIANSVKADYTLKRNIFSMAYTHEDDVIARFQPKVDAATNKQTLTSQNLDYRKTVTVTVLVPFTIASWWSMQTNAIGTWQKQNLVYNSSPIQIEQKNFHITNSQNFTLPKDYSLELSGFYQSAGIFAMSIIKSFGALNFGAQKKFNNGNAILRFNVTDIFNTVKLKGHIDLPEHNLVGTSQFQFTPRTFRLTFTQNFGSNTVKSKSNRTTGSEEERKRVE